MKIYIAIFIILIMAVSASAVNLEIIPTNFLKAPEPIRLTNGYVTQNYGTEATMFVQPTGGALVRIQQASRYHIAYIFCDAALNKLRIFLLNEVGGVRTPLGIKNYGLINNFVSFTIGDTIGESFMVAMPPAQMYHFSQPVDVAVSSCGHDFNPSEDFIFVLDQVNRRVVKFRYDDTQDSLIWLSSFGDDVLQFPTALDYANYGDEVDDNDDIYVVDASLGQLLRFSATGAIETRFGMRGDDLTAIGYPAGIAVSTSPSCPNRIYVSDSRNHRITGYYSETNGPIYLDKWFIFPINPYPVLTGIDTDGDGYVYVTDQSNHNINVLTPELDQIFMQYGKQGYEPGQFDAPQDIYIDGHEMQVFDTWGDSSGIQSFAIVPGSPKKTIDEPIPGKFFLSQNYPNPFNSSTTIMFELPQPGNVEIVIYNILGQRVKSLVDDKMPAGSHSVIWNGTNQTGDLVSSGVYFYRLRAGDQVAAKKLLLLK